MKRILVTGGSGFIGKYLCKAFIKDDYEVFSTTRNINKQPPKTKVNWLEWDMAKGEVSNLPSGLDVIIHLAQSEQYRNFPSGAEDMFCVNVESTFRLLEYARKNGIKQFIFASTGSVYGPASDKTFSENSVFINKADFYSKSKWIAEKLIENYNEFFSCVVARIFFPYGKNQQKERFLPRLIKSIKDGQPVKLEGEQGLEINPIHIEDVVEFFESLVKNEKATGIYNLAGPDIVSIKTIAEMIGEKLGVNPAYEVNRVQAKKYIGDMRLVEEKLNFRPRISFSEGITELMDEIQ